MIYRRAAAFDAGDEPPRIACRENRRSRLKSVVGRVLPAPMPAARRRRRPAKLQAQLFFFT